MEDGTKDKSKNGNGNRSPFDAMGEEEIVRMLCSPETNHYRRLGLPFQLEVDVSLLNLNHRVLSLRVHPDKCKHPLATVATAELNNAKDILSGEKSRVQYFQQQKQPPSTSNEGGKGDKEKNKKRKGPSSSTKNSNNTKSNNKRKKTTSTPSSSSGSKNRQSQEEKNKSYTDQKKNKKTHKNRNDDSSHTTSTSSSSGGADNNNNNDRNNKKDDSKSNNTKESNYDGPRYTWSPSQKDALQSCISGRNTFITGGGGVGKSEVLKEIIDTLRKMGKVVGVSSPTGMAAVPLGGMTLHSLVGAGIPDGITDSALFKKFTDNKDNKVRWSTMDVLIIEEISMMDVIFFQRIDTLIKKIRNNTKPFGGIQLIVVGDFGQLPPVKSFSVVSCREEQVEKSRNKKNKRGVMNVDIDDATDEIDKKVLNFCFELELWRRLDFSVVQLKKVFRQKEDEFIDLLNRMRLGEHTERDVELLRSRVNVRLDEDDGIAATRLYPYKKDVNDENNSKLNSLPGDAIIYHSKYRWKNGDENLDDDVKKLRTQMIKAMKKSCPAEPILSLKIGAQVVLLANLDFQNHLVNGSRGIVIGFDEGVGSDDDDGDSSSSNAEDDEDKDDEDDNEDSGEVKRKKKEKKNTKQKRPIEKYPIVRFVDGSEVTIYPFEWSSDSHKAGTLKYSQIPLTLAWSLTVHRCQGMSLDKVVVSMRGIFAPGQAYVALSRVKSFAGLSIVDMDVDVICAHPKVIQFYRNGCRCDYTININMMEVIRNQKLDRERDFEKDNSNNGDNNNNKNKKNRWSSFSTNATSTKNGDRNCGMMHNSFFESNTLPSYFISSGSTNNRNNNNRSSSFSSSFSPSTIPDGKKEE